MQTFQNTVMIARPVGEVFAFLADLRNIPRWNYAIARTVPTSPGPAGPGATYRQTRTIPRRSEENLQITVFQPPTRLAVQGQLGPFRATASYLLEPVPTGTPAGQRCRAGTPIGPATADRPAGGTSSQGRGRT
jgi:Polyketide cyclase / dehydrase and lipid transport